jgi:histidinol-phosphate phosphatase family protein
LRALEREGVTLLKFLAGEGGPPTPVSVMAEAQSLGIALDMIGGRDAAAASVAALAHVDDDVLIVAGDVVFDLALKPLRQFHHGCGACLTVVAQPCLDPRRSDLVREREGRVVEFFPRECKRKDERNLAPTGIYLASPSLFAHPAWRGGGADLRAVVPALLAAGVPVGCYQTPEYVRVLGSPEQCAAAERDLADGRIEALRLGHKRPAILFDCDGVLNEERPPAGVLRPDEIELVPGAADAVRRAREAGFITMAITNRAQVARGEITFAELDQILGRVEALLAAEGGLLDRIYVCPHHPAPDRPGAVRELSITCECRKPGTLLFRRALTELPVDVARSFAIGDSLRDIGAAQAVGLRAYGVRTGYGCIDFKRYPGGKNAAPAPDLLFADVGAAVDFILSRRS